MIALPKIDNRCQPIQCHKLAVIIDLDDDLIVSVSFNKLEQLIRSERDPHIFLGKILEFYPAKSISLVHQFIQKLRASVLGSLIQHKPVESISGRAIHLIKDLLGIFQPIIAQGENSHLRICFLRTISKIRQENRASSWIESWLKHRRSSLRIFPAMDRMLRGAIVRTQVI